MLQNAFKRRRLSLCPAAVELEARSLLSGYSATSIEQLYLEELDDARFDPAAFGVSLGLDLSSVAPSQPLAMSPLLVESARLHSQDMIAQNYFSHTAPDGSGPEQRIQATGFPGTGWAESIEYNSEPVLTSQGFPANYAAANTEYSLGDLIVDQGNPTLGHRVMLLDIGGTFHPMRQVGIGLAFQDSPSGSYTYRQTDTTIDMSSTADSNPFLTGVVFNDTAANGEYEPGEGRSGVNISVAGAGSTTTSDAGGYSIQLAPGNYTVTASGGGLPAPITRTVVLGNDNARLNFDQNPNGASFSATTVNPASVTLGSFTAIEAGDTPSSYSARVDWGNGTASTATLTPTANGGFTVTGQEPYGDDGDFAVRVLITHESDGRSIALNGTASVTGTPTSTGTHSGGGTGTGAGTGTGTGTGTGVGSTSGPGSGQGQKNPSTGPLTFFVARLNQRAKPKYFDVITLVNDTGKPLTSRNIVRLIIKKKSYKLHITNWANGAVAVIVLNASFKTPEPFTVDFLNQKTIALTSRVQNKQNKSFAPTPTNLFQITPTGTVIPGSA